MFTKCMFFYEQLQFQNENVGFFAKIMTNQEWKILIVELTYAYFIINEFPKNEL